MELAGASKVPHVVHAVAAAAFGLLQRSLLPPALGFLQCPVQVDGQWLPIASYHYLLSKKNPGLDPGF